MIGRILAILVILKFYQGENYHFLMVITSIIYILRGLLFQFIPFIISNIPEIITSSLEITRNSINNTEWSIDMI